MTMVSLLFAEGGQFDGLCAGFYEVIGHPGDTEEVHEHVGFLRRNGDLGCITHNLSPLVLDVGDNFLPLTLEVGEFLLVLRDGVFRFLHILFGILRHTIFRDRGGKALLATKTKKPGNCFRATKPGLNIAVSQVLLVLP